MASVDDVVSSVPDHLEKIKTATDGIVPRPAFQKTGDTIQYNDRWISSYQLPARFSPRVTAALERKNLPGNVRDEFNRDICSSIKVHTMNPKKHERETVAFKIISKYPFLADKIGSGISSWDMSIKNGFKNLRKTKRGYQSQSGVCMIGVQTKKNKVADDAPLALVEGETTQTCQDHLAAIKREMAKNKNRNVALIKELMELTYPYRRNKVVSSPTTLKDLLAEYPALRLVSELKAEFERATSSIGKCRKMSHIFRNNVKPKIISLAQSKVKAFPGIASILKLMEEETTDSPTKKTEIEEDGAVMLVQQLLREKTNRYDPVVKICSDDESIDKVIESVVAPKLIGSGQYGSITPLYLVAEGEVIIKFPNTGLINALVVLLAAYYAFNIKYPNKGRNLFSFIEATLLGNFEDAKKRVSINRLLKDMAFL
ncbi:uncharacterized protein LOC114542873 [Dendronephthya gigantea]|uniref:uncharacterized protein LOC114542873 n=2 Tax=Dendronephthya gigantea TaxID=151771 RepID=UPI001068DDEC|nr:uncharacterized protein LOC114542873 [Dendronephthya gigantea]